MKKRLSTPKQTLHITTADTRIHWTNDLSIDIPVRSGVLSLEGDHLHHQLKYLAMQSPKYNEKNVLIATLTLVASNESTSYSFQVPIEAKFDTSTYRQCFTNSAPYEVDEYDICQHINQRFMVANDFMGLSIPSELMPNEHDYGEFKWRTYHSEQALIEYLFKRKSLDNILSKMCELGLLNYKYIDAVILDLHSKYYVCEFCEVSLFGIQDPSHKKGWLKSALEPCLQKGGFQFSEDGINMVTRISADRAFPRTNHEQIMTNQTELFQHHLGYFGNRVILAKDVSTIQPVHGLLSPLPYSYFMSGSDTSKESSKQLKRSYATMRK